MRFGRMMGIVVLSLLAGSVRGQKMSVTDSDGHILMEVNDEGTVGAITLPDSTVAPKVTTNKLYNVAGALYWNGAALGSSGSAGGWTDDGASVFTTTASDKVGIGTSSPDFMLSLDTDGGILAKGTAASGSSLLTSGSGTRLIWYPRKAAFRAGGVSDSQWDDANIGLHSVAMGLSAIASGDRSMAMGSGTTASGTGSCAVGSYGVASGNQAAVFGMSNTASGIAATAMGWETVASGNNSAAMGRRTRAAAYMSTAVGGCNVGSGSPDTWIETDPIFEIGNSINPDQRTNAMTVLKNGKVGIGTSAPEFMLSLETDGGIIAKGVFGEGADLATSGGGTRMIWYPRKAAFRAGAIGSSQWDDGNIGNYSAAMGQLTTASGSVSTALGYYTLANGPYSTALGHSTTASGEKSTAMGMETSASGSEATAIGKEAKASGAISTALGYRTSASGLCAVAMGDETTARGGYSTATGGWTIAGGTYSMATGSGTKAIGAMSASFGAGTVAGSHLSFTLGRYNVGAGDSTAWVSTDPLFEIGNGDSPSDPNNAITVLKNGNVGIGVLTPVYLLEMAGGGYYDSADGQWHPGSSRAIKRDIRSNSMDVGEILEQVQVVNYRYRNEVDANPEAPYHIGFIAEDTPRLLSGRNQDGMSVVDCVGLLLAVVKEQQKEIEALKERIGE